MSPRGSSIDSLIRRRRMTRRFAHDALDDGVLAEMLELARRAPSAGFSQGLTLLVLKGPSRTRFFEITGAAEWFAKTSPGVLAAPVVVLVLADPNAYTARYAEGDKAGHGLEDAAMWPVPFWLTDAAMAAQNLLLLAEDRGLGALLFGIFQNAREALAELGVPEGIVGVAAIAIGHRAPDDAPSGSALTRPRRSPGDVVRYDHW